MARPTPTMNQVQDERQLLKLLRGLIEDLTNLDARSQQLAAGIASAPSQVDPGVWLEKNGQAALTKLGVDGAAQARNTYLDRDPTANDDASQGYGYFSRWINTSSGVLFTCTNPAEGGAVWI